MMSLADIARMADEAGRKAKRHGKKPLMVRDYHLSATEDLGGYLRYMPFLGPYVPKGFEKVDVYFVDSSGWGSPGEPALAIEEFYAKVREAGPDFGYAITEAGEFQVYVGRYKETE